MDVNSSIVVVVCTRDLFSRLVELRSRKIGIYSTHAGIAVRTTMHSRCFRKKHYLLCQASLLHKLSTSKLN